MILKLPIFININSSFYVTHHTICLDKSFEKFSFFGLFFYRLIDSSFVLFSWILSSIALEEVFSGAKQQRYLSSFALY